MKRFLVFYGEKYYSNGGMNDFTGDFDDLRQIKIILLKGKTEDHWNDYWAHVYDCQKKKIVFKIGKQLGED